MSFADIKGQDSVIGYLKSSIKNDRLSHAYIFLGPRGSGRRLVALNFAKVLNCHSPSSYEPCEVCASCLKVNKSLHPDVSIFKAEKAGGSIKIEDIRRLISDISLRPFEGRKKVYIIDDAEDMKHEAANAVLKTLEEPPTDSVLILITDNLNALFHTIVSRSQVVRFLPLKAAEIKKILMEDTSVDETKAHILSHLAGGRIAEALRFKGDELFSKRSLLLSSISSRDRLLTDFDDLTKETARLYLGILSSWYSDILKTKAGAPEEALVNIDKKDIITSEAGRLDFDYLEDVLKGIMETSAYLEQNVNQKLAMAALGIKINRANTCTK